MIHRLYSTLQTFKTLKFHSGLNVLIAKKEHGASNKQTRNRAGKTSLIEIVHFLTGANAGKDSLFRTEALGDVAFGMEFDLGGAKTSVERKGNDKSNVHVSGGGFPGGNAKLANTKWVELLGKQMFSLDGIQAEVGRSPTFRSLFAYFVRRQPSGAFTTPEKQATDQQVGDYQMALMYLLGLD